MKSFDYPVIFQSWKFINFTNLFYRLGKCFLFHHIISGPKMLYNFLISFSRLGIPWNMESHGK